MSESRIKTFATGMKKKGPARNYIDIEFKILEEKYNFHSRMFTLVHEPNEIDINRAWDWVLFDVEKIKKIVTDSKHNILFTVLTIEVHMAENEGDKQTLKGYPHIHFTVFRTTNGKIESFNELHSLLRTETTFGKSGADIRIDGETRKKGRSLEKNNISFLRYTLKNSRHELPHNKLKEAYNKYKDRLKEDTTTKNCILIDNSGDKDIIDFFKELNNRKMLIHIPEEKLEITEVKERKMRGIHGKNGTRPITVKNTQQGQWVWK